MVSAHGLSSDIDYRTGFDGLLRAIAKGRQTREPGETCRVGGACRWLVGSSGRGGLGRRLGELDKQRSQVFQFGFAQVTLHVHAELRRTRRFDDLQTAVGAGLGTGCVPHLRRKRDGDASPSAVTTLKSVWLLPRNASDDSRTGPVWGATDEATDEATDGLSRELPRAKDRLLSSPCLAARGLAS